MSKSQDHAEDLFVSSSTPVQELAKAIASRLRQGREIVMLAIGHQAVGQAVKAVPIVNGWFASNGVIYDIRPSFELRHIKDGDQTVERTAMRMKLVRSEL